MIGLQYILYNDKREFLCNINLIVIETHYDLLICILKNFNFKKYLYILIKVIFKFYFKI